YLFCTYHIIRSYTWLWTYIAFDTLHSLQNQSGDAKQEFVILKRFEFEHERGTMCVIALDTNTYKLYVFCKGSVEKVTQLCRPSGIPNATSHVVKSAAKRGAYVLAVAHKMLGTVPEPNLTTEQKRATRTFIEGRRLLGLFMSVYL
ncbi:hypothetical protein SARC_15535, partial [Sphaeroforma arctica JP610]